MRAVREVLRLRFDGGLSSRAVAVRVGVAASTVREMAKRFKASGLAWPLADGLGDAALEVLLYGPAGAKPGRRKFVEPDWAVVHQELKKNKHVTLQVLWEEYSALNPDGYGYSRYCDLYRGWEGRLPLTMRQTHKAGEKLFVDYAGDTVSVVVNRLTGERRQAHLFVAVLGASSLSFGWASWTEKQADWSQAHVECFAYMGGAPELLVPDNCKVAVIKASLYDPQVNRSYAELARHYGTTVLPTRPRRPKDKAKVEACVGIIQRWLLGRLRNRVFYSLAALNREIMVMLGFLNDERVLRQFGKTRRQLFEELDKPLLKPLPTARYVYADWKQCRAGLDYHIEVDRHHYSVPHRYAKKQVDVRLTLHTVEVYLAGERIASHLRGSSDGGQTTVNDHMPSSHRRYAGWDRPKLVETATRIGPTMLILCEKILADRPHPEQGFRACRGILGLERRFGAPRLEAAALYALEIGARNYQSVQSILDKGLESQPPRKVQDDDAPITHPNIRGSGYYH
jgi:transposase